MHRCYRCTRLMCHCEERSNAAISGRHWHPTPATMKTVCTDCVCSGGQRPPLAVTGFCAPSPTVQCPQICHCEAPTGPWQSREGSCVFADSCPTIQPGTARLPRARSALAMTSLGALHIRRKYLQICSCQRRSLTAATDAIGAYRFHGGLYKSAVPPRDCHVGCASSQ